VLPLQNLSGDTGQDFFADGLTEELTSRLARLKELRIVSRTSAMTYRGRSRALPEIARDLDVDAVIEGSVRRDGDRVRISVQLVHGPSDTHLWAREYDARLVDLLDLQTQVARDVARELRVRTTSQTAVKTDRDVDPSAYEAYLRGRFHLWKFTESDRVQALEYFQRALDIDPDYAPAWAGIAHTWWARGVFGPMTLTEVAEPARAAATRALLLDDSLPEAHAHMAYLQGMFDWRWQEAEATVRRAVTLGPNSVDASYVYAVLLMALGRRAEAIEWADRAVRLDPLSAVTHSMAGRTRYRARQFAEAVAPLRRAIELEPANPLSIQRLGDVYLQMGRYSEAQALYAKAAGLGVEADGRRALLYARMGRRDEAQAILRQVPPEKRWPTVVVALGDHDGAFDLLFKAIDSRSESLLYIKDDPLYQPLHTDVRWPHLLERMNLQ
jgi:TolB-like protein/Tfp pilus assembly protein PilF